MKGMGILLGIGLSVSSAAFAQTDAERRARWEKGQAEQQRFEHRLFNEAGFTPIEEVRAAGRDVRRLLLHDPYMMLPVPGTEVERHSNGRVTLRLQYRGWSSRPVEIDGAAWEALGAGEQAVFVRPAYVPAGPARPSSMPPPSPPPICHGWIARFEADENRTASWSACGGEKTAAYDYAVRLVALAIGTRPGCAVERNDPFWSFSQCFAAKEALDDPALEAKFAILRQEYAGAPGMERLAEARAALAAPGMALGSPAWREARAAIAKLKAVNDHRRDRLQQLQQLAYGAAEASPADKAKMRQTIQGWSEFLHSQEINHSELLRQLAWVGG
jgi:hypothetical protein